MKSMKKSLLIFLLVIIVTSLFLIRDTHAKEEITGLYTQVYFDADPVEGNDFVLLVRVDLNISGWEVWFGDKIVAGPADAPHSAGSAFQIIIYKEYMTAGKKEVRVIIRPGMKTDPSDLLFFDLYVQHVLSDGEKIASFSFIGLIVGVVYVIRRDYLKWQEKQWTTLFFTQYVKYRLKIILLVVLCFSMFLLFVWGLSVFGGGKVR